MREPIENEYFNWLCAKVLDPRTNGHMYIDLLRILYSTPFEWSISGDMNRADDGREFRLDFLRQSGWAQDQIWLEQPCSVLEMLIALSYRAAFQTDISARDWFWQLVANLGLDECRRLSRAEEGFVKDTIRRFNMRRYTDGGRGGIFPLRWPKHDQRKVEIWVQLCEYLDENELV